MSEYSDDGELCLHCGRSIPSKKRTGPFCCDGCAAVHELIQSEGLNDFYKLQDRAGQPLGEKPLEEAETDWAREIQIETEATNDSGTASLQIRMEGLTCMGCLWLVEELARKSLGVRQVRASLSGRSVSLEWVKGELDLPELVQRWQRFGYSSGPLREGGLRLDGLAWRAALCSLFAGNMLVLFLIERFAGSEFGQSTLLDLLELLFLLFSGLVGVSYFMLPVIRAGRIKRLHFDLLLSLGLLIYLFFGLFETVGVSAIEMADLLFSLTVAALLWSRWFQNRWMGSSSQARKERHLRYHARWMDLYGGALIVGSAILFGWVALGEGLLLAFMTWVAVLLAAVVYPAQVFIEESRPVWQIIGAMLIGGFGIFVPFLGPTSIVTAVVWQLVAANLLVFFVANFGKAKESSIE